MFLGIPYMVRYQHWFADNKQRSTFTHPQPALRWLLPRHNLRMFVSSWVSGVARLVMSATQKPRVVFVLGSPGAGKGTQCKNIMKEFGYIHLSAGDLLREERNKPGSEYGEMIEEHIRNGTIVPVEITCSLIQRAMQNAGANKFLIDGFPRNKENLEGWAKNMEDCVQLEGVLFLDCPEDVSTARCLGRGAKGSGRSDDNPESLKKRFETYVKDTMPIIEHYEKLNLVRRVDSKKSPSHVFEDIKGIFQQFQ